LVSRFVACVVILFSISVSGFSHAETAAADNLLLLDAARAGDRMVAVGERGSILLSDDNGSSWRRAASPTESTLTAVYFHDDKLGWASGHDAVILRTSDGGETWQQTLFAPEKETPLLDVCFLNERQGFAVGAYGTFYESADGGMTWRQRQAFRDDLHKNALVCGPRTELFIAGESGALYHSFDSGQTWKRLASPYRGSYFGVLLLQDNSLLIFGLRGKIYRSADRGMSWKPVRADSQATLMGGLVLGDGRVVLVGHEGTVLVSGDQGKSFSLRKNPGGKALSSVASTGDGSLLLFGEAGAKKMASW
jgi:photosystem II stability/assembly factor-like uncharacterized protein